MPHTYTGTTSTIARCTTCLNVLFLNNHSLPLAADACAICIEGRARYIQNNAEPPPDATPPHTPVPPSDAPPDTCRNGHVIEWKVSKTSKNPDRVFYSCKECDAFAWQDQIEKLGRCWKCNGRGHWASKCPFPCGTAYIRACYPQTPPAAAPLPPALTTAQTQRIEGNRRAALERRGVAAAAEAVAIANAAVLGTPTAAATCAAAVPARLRPHRPHMHRRHDPRTRSAGTPSRPRARPARPPPARASRRRSTSKPRGSTASASTRSTTRRSGFRGATPDAPRAQRRWACGRTACACAESRCVGRALRTVNRTHSLPERSVRVSCTVRGRQSSVGGRARVQCGCVQREPNLMRSFEVRGYRTC